MGGSPCRVRGEDGPIGFPGHKILADPRSHPLTSSSSRLVPASPPHPPSSSHARPCVSALCTTLRRVAFSGRESEQPGSESDVPGFEPHHCPFLAHVTFLRLFSAPWASHREGSWRGAAGTVPQGPGSGGGPRTTALALDTSLLFRQAHSLPGAALTSLLCSPAGRGELHTRTGQSGEHPPGRWQGPLSF